jgi:hypothetical protein
VYQALIDRGGFTARTAFTIDMSSPFPLGFTRSLGGPNEGGHSGEWHDRFGMDFAASVGPEVHAGSRGGAHLHWALVEIIGGAPGGRYVGINPYKDFQKVSNTTSVLSVTFKQNGTPPKVA